METTTNLLAILSLNSFVASALILLFRRRAIAELLAIASAILSLAISMYLISLPYLPIEIQFLPHISLYLDRLSAFFSLVVSLIGSAVAIYSVDYMKNAKDFTRYYSLISLFVGAMLNLVLASDIIYLLLNWELVGVCSALLIAYWWERKEARRAGMKALIMTRIGDVGLMAFASIALYYGESSIPAILSSQQLSLKLIPFLPLLVLAAMGKSAQFPLHTWLPDAMEGPTTVSALLHAATMVKAGVYLMLRFYPIFLGNQAAVAFLLAVSIITLYLSSLAGLVSMDIKRVLAFSTLSSLSLMFIAICLGEFYVALLYLFNHALFKALLFLVSGRVEHSLHTRDISRLKGLWGKGFKIETAGFLIGALSAAGLPPLSAGIVKEELFVGMIPHFSLLEYYLIAGTMSFLMAIFIMRPFVLSFLGRTSNEGAHDKERTPLMTGVNLFLLAMTLIAIVPTIIISRYLGGSGLKLEIETLPFLGVLLGILCAFFIPRTNVSISNIMRKSIESSFGIDIAYNRIGEVFYRYISMAASKLNSGKASQGLRGMIAIVVLIIIALVVFAP
ncbi:MAG: NADH-quinone oxidoreductase subunit L [Fervidicoccaceae archaeon]